MCFAHQNLSDIQVDWIQPYPCSDNRAKQAVLLFTRSTRWMTLFC